MQKLNGLNKMYKSLKEINIRFAVDLQPMDNITATH